MPATLHIFPSTAAAESFNREIAGKSGVLFGTTALTLKRLCEEIFKFSDESKPLISNVGAKLLLEEIVQERYREGVGRLARIKDFPGFVGTVESLFGELKQARVTADAFAHTVRLMPQNERVMELASLYGLYADTLDGKGLMDHHDTGLSALGHLRRGGKLPPIFDDVGSIKIHSIYDVTPLQLALIVELSRRLPACLELPYNPDHATLYTYAAKTADAVEALDNSDLHLELEFLEPAGAFLTPILEALFGDNKERKAIAPPAPIALMAAPGAYRECEEIGRRIRGLMEEGVDPTDISVMFRDLRGYAPMLEDVCRRFGIPVSYRRGAPLFTSSLVRASLAPFAVSQSRFGREELLAVCNSSYLDIPMGGLSRKTIEEVLVASRYVDETLGTVEMMIGRRIAALQKGNKSREKEELTLRALLPLLKDLRRFRGEKTVDEFVGLLTHFIGKYRIFAMAIDVSEQRSLKRDASAVTLFQQALRDLEKDIRTLGFTGKKLEPAEFLDLLEYGMEGLFLSGERRSGVSILNFHDARGLIFPHVFIGGLNEGVCPMQRDGHPLFKDCDKLLYQRVAGEKLFRTAAEKGEEEPLLFYLAVGCAAESLTLSYSYADRRGNAAVRSPFLDELLATVQINETRIPVSRITPGIDECLEREELLNSLALNKSYAAANDVPDILREPLARIKANAEIEAQRELFFDTEEMTTRSALSTPYTGTLKTAEILAELRAFFESPEGNHFAPTIMEEYGCCPFRYFMKRLLNIFPVERPDMELEAREEGSLVHEVIRAFFQRMKNEGKLPITEIEAAKTILREEAAQVFAQWEADKYTGEPLLWECEKEKLIPILERLVEIEGEDQSGFVPHAFEQEFIPLEVDDCHGSKFFLSGKIDRVDIAPASGMVRVVDYKMAGNSQKYRELLKKEAMGDTSFQMPVYLLAAAREMGKESCANFDSFNALYWLLRKVTPLRKDFSAAKGEDFTGFFTTDMGERNVLGDNNFLNRLCNKVSAMKHGDFQITPKECEYCDFNSVCRYVEVSLKGEEP